MIRGLLHRLVSHPTVYDAVQIMVGAAALRKRIAKLAKTLPKPSVVLDVGGGTGSIRALFDPTTQYICLDIDPEKIRGFRAKEPDGLALLADATHCPLADQSVDLIACTAVSHHLDDAQLARLFAHCRRILKPGGHLLFVDAVWAPYRLPGRLIWHFDRGSNPRTPATICTAIQKELTVKRWEELALLHRYVLVTATPAGN